MRASLATLREAGSLLQPVDDWREVRGGVSGNSHGKAKSFQPSPLAQPDPAIERAARFAGVMQMHDRLVEYGQVYVRIGVASMDDTETPTAKVSWSAAQQEAAATLHGIIIKLELRLNLTLQVFYKASSAGVWHKLSLVQQRTILERQAREINHRLEKAKDVHRVKGRDLDVIRDSAIRRVIANERFREVAATMAKDDAPVEVRYVRKQTDER